MEESLDGDGRQMTLFLKILWKCKNIVALIHNFYTVSTFRESLIITLYVFVTVPLLCLLDWTLSLEWEVSDFSNLYSELVIK